MTTATLNEFEVEKADPVFEFDYLVNDLNMLAKYYFDLYFCDKTGPAGLPWPRSVLHSAENTSKVLNTDICRGMEEVYKMIGVEYSAEEYRHFERQGQLPSDVKYVISMLHECSRKGIPKQFAIGIFLMHLKLCEEYKLA